MRNYILTCVLCALGVSAFSQNNNQKQSVSLDTNRVTNVKTSTATNLNISGSLFISGVVPNDLPERSNYKSDEVYFKVIQGYINVHSEIIVKPKALELGFTYPEVIDIKNERETDMRQSRIRKEPISEEEIELKKKKEKELESPKQ